MEPITHFLTGACLARAGFNRRTALATLTMTLAAEAPDLDIIGSFKDPVFAFAHHRGFTHSFLGLIFISALVVGFVYLISRVRGRPLKDPSLQPKWGLLLALAYLAGLSHILLDYTNNYGVRPFWPLSEKWYSWDIVFIIEPALLLLLAGGLLVPSLWLRVKGERNNYRIFPTSARIALVGVLAVWGIRTFEHTRAVQAMLSANVNNQTPIRASAYPYWWNPFRWMGVAEMKDFFVVLPLHTHQSDIRDDARQHLYLKPAETPVTLAAKNSELGRVYLDWAKYPLVEQFSSGDGFSVLFKDLRFAYPERLNSNTLAATVELDRDLRVTVEAMGRRKRAVNASRP